MQTILYGVDSNFYRLDALVVIDAEIQAASDQVTRVAKETAVGDQRQLLKQQAFAGTVAKLHLVATLADDHRLLIVDFTHVCNQLVSPYLGRSTFKRPAKKYTAKPGDFVAGNAGAQSRYLL